MGQTNGRTDTASLIAPCPIRVIIIIIRPYLYCVGRGVAVGYEVQGIGLAIENPRRYMPRPAVHTDITH